jgi:hypothetical protein
MKSIQITSFIQKPFKKETQKPCVALTEFRPPNPLCDPLDHLRHYMLHEGYCSECYEHSQYHDNVPETWIHNYDHLSEYYEPFFVTYTSNPHYASNNPWDISFDHWSHVMTESVLPKVFKTFRNNGCTSIRMLCALEFTKAMVIHAHLLILVSKDYRKIRGVLKPFNQLQELRKLGCYFGKHDKRTLGTIDVQACQSITNTVAYIKKSVKDMKEDYGLDSLLADDISCKIDSLVWIDQENDHNN